MAAEIIDIMKLGSDENIELGDSVPVVELDKINSIGRWKDIPPPDTLGLIVLAYAPDEETKATAEVLKMLQKQQPAAGHHGSSYLSTPPGEAKYFKGGGLMRTVRELVKSQKMHSSPVSQPLTPVTPAGSISTITVGILPLVRVLLEDVMKATIKKVHPTYSRWLQSVLAGSLPVNQQVPMVQAIKVDLRTTQHHPQGWVHQLHAPVHLAPMAVQQAVAPRS